MISSQDMEIIWELTITDFKLKYRNSYFGYVWSVVNPLLLLTTLYVVFSHVIHLDIPNYQLFLLIGIILWNYFSEATSKSLSFLEGNISLLQKHKIRPIIFVFSTCLSSLITLLFNFAVFLVFVIIFMKRIEIISVFCLLYILILFVLALSVSMTLVVIYSYFKDITHIWQFCLLVGFWLSPIIYSEMILPVTIRNIYMLNPIARIISQMRNIFIYHYLDNAAQLGITLLFIGIIFCFSISLIMKFSEGFGERL